MIAILPLVLFDIMVVYAILARILANSGKLFCIKVSLSTCQPIVFPILSIAFVIPVLVFAILVRAFAMLSLALAIPALAFAILQIAFAIR